MIYGAGKRGSDSGWIALHMYNSLSFSIDGVSVVCTANFLTDIIARNLPFAFRINQTSQEIELKHAFELI